MHLEIIEIIGKTMNTLVAAKRINRTLKMMKIISIFGVISVVGFNVYSAIRNS